MADCNPSVGDPYATHMAAGANVPVDMEPVYPLAA